MEENNPSENDLDQSLKNRAVHTAHDWPQYDPEFCSCCRKRFIHGLTNVVRIAIAPERQLDFNGNVIGIKKGAAYRAVLHGDCANRHFARRFECEKCGGFSKILKLADGTQNTCPCTCHTGSEHCSYVLEPNAKNKQKVFKNGPTPRRKAD